MIKLSTTIACLSALWITTTPASAQPYYELYAGASVGGQDLNYGPTPPSSPNLVSMDAGTTFGGGVYWTNILPPFELGLDVMMTNQDYSTWGPGSNLSTTSLMANGRWNFGITQGITGYMGAGLGAINVSYDDPAAFLDGSDTIAGWQAEIGVKYQLGTLPAFASIKYQQGFNQAYIQTESVEYNSLNVLAGVRF